MKIALVNHTFSPSHGGLERFSVNLATILWKNGHNVHLYAHRAEDLPEGIPVHHVPMSRKPSFWRLLSFHRNVRILLEGQGFDLVYGLTRFFPLDIYRLGDGVQRHWMRLRYPLAPWRWVNYLVNPVHWVNLALERQILGPKSSATIITNSHLVKEHVARYYGTDPRRVNVVYNGVDHDKFNPESVGEYRNVTRAQLGLNEDAVLILYVSNNWKRKGLEVLMKSVAHLGEKGRSFHVAVVGRGRPAPFIRHASSMGLDGRVHFVGPTREVEKYYGAGDLLVLPTMYDPFSNVCLEAMACGLPVVTTRENGASELIRAGENGYVQNDAQNVEELSSLIANFTDRSRCASMGANARNISLPFTFERNMQENLEIFARLNDEMNMSQVVPKDVMG